MKTIAGLNKMKISNCLIFAAIKCIENGDYIVIRKSRHKHKWPFKYHFLTVPKEVINKHASSFIPVKKDLGNYPPPLFFGKIKKGD